LLASGHQEGMHVLADVADDANIGEVRAQLVGVPPDVQGGVVLSGGITYARRLADAGCRPSCTYTPAHTPFEGLASGADVSRRAINDQMRCLRTL
jgi:hypothetical protein